LRLSFRAFVPHQVGACAVSLITRFARQIG
jgi:hypothetical protein